jgi:plastocyanin
MSTRFPLPEAHSSDKRRRTSSAFAAAAGVALLALTVAACGSSKKAGTSEQGGQSSGTKTTIAGLSANDHGSKEVSGTAEVELDDFYFNPTVLKGKPGSKVTLTLKNDGKVKHNFDLDAQKIDKDIDPGKSTTVTVTIPQSGQVSFFCKYHKSMGMAGALQASG